MRYSKRKLKGLPTPKEIIIKSLGNYIKLFSTNKFDNYIFRGEPTNFYSTVSSALRKAKEEYPFIQMKNEFKREIFHKLTPDERNNFLAFAQHHGIPTNLIDFTRAPLVALYFACQSFVGNNDIFDKERGFVYLIKDELIDITPLITKSEDENILNLFIRNVNDIVLDFYKRFMKFEKKYSEKFYYYFKKLVDDRQYYLIDMQSKTSKKPKFPTYSDGEYKIKLKYEYVSKNKKMINTLEKQNERIVLSVLEYTLMLQDFLYQILKIGLTVWQLNCIPNFIYSPILPFERGRNQKGLFIYQAYLSFDEGAYGAHILSIQRLWPEIIFVIENKNTILKELDLIDINEKFIYGDYDSIAKYIKRKYN